MGRVRRPRRAVAAIALIAAVVALIDSGTAYAHPTGTTLLTVSRADANVELDVLIPLDRLELVVGTDLTDDPVAEIAANRAVFRDMFATQVGVVGPSGAAWTITLEDLAPGSLDGIDQLHARMMATPPTGESVITFTLAYHVVVDTIVTHNVYVATRAAGDGSVELLGTINHRHPSLTVELEHPSGVTLGTMIRQGIDHFRSGTDHLLFLTLVVAGAAFERHRTRRRLADLAVRTGAFTVGHSISLALATAGVVSLPSRVVEAAIAVTILLGAIHLARPIVPRRCEPAITIAFGFVHGFGFAATLSDLGLSGRALVVPTLGFNIGLEVAQLGAAILIAPSLWWLARRRFAHSAIGGICAIVAVGWIVERTIGGPNLLDGLVGLMAGTPERLALVLAAVAVVAARPKFRSFSASVATRFTSPSFTDHRSAPLRALPTDRTSP